MFLLLKSERAWKYFVMERKKTRRIHIRLQGVFIAFRFLWCWGKDIQRFLGSIQFHRERAKLVKMCKFWIKYNGVSALCNIRPRCMVCMPFPLTNSVKTWPLNEPWQRSKLASARLSDAFLRETQSWERFECSRLCRFRTSEKLNLTLTWNFLNPIHPQENFGAFSKRRFETFKACQKKLSAGLEVKEGQIICKQDTFLHTVDEHSSASKAVEIYSAYLSGGQKLWETKSIFVLFSLAFCLLAKDSKVSET